MDFQEVYKAKISQIDDYIEKYLDSQKNIEPLMKEAMKYSVLNGGKRLRSILCTEICALLGADRKKSMPFAMAIEFIHAYSLVHDDLPSMDNADTRRGMPSCHKKYGEGFAVLTGDALLNLAYEVMAQECSNGTEGAADAMKIIANCAGIHGMVNGQAIDLKLPECEHVTEADLITLIEQKTMALIRASVISGAIVAGASDNNIKLLEEYAYSLGLAFQIRDDFEDEIEDGADANDSPNFINILGRNAAYDKLEIHQKKAYNIISSFGDDSFLCDFHKYLFN
jgi:geranylgeranyl diphosphate synthase type II